MLFHSLLLKELKKGLVIVKIVLVKVLREIYIVLREGCFVNVYFSRHRRRFLAYLSSWINKRHLAKYGDEDKWSFWLMAVIIELGVENNIIFKKNQNGSQKSSEILKETYINSLYSQPFDEQRGKRD